MCKVDDSYVKVFDLRKSNIDAFCHNVACINWSVIQSSVSVPDAIEYFYDQFSQAMSTIPVTFVKLNSKTKPWITPVLLDLIHKRWKAYRQRNFTLYNHYKAKVS